MPGKQYIDINRVISCIQELKTLIAALPEVEQGDQTAETISYYAKIYIITMSGELVGLAKRLDVLLANDPILKIWVENRNKLFHSKEGKSSWLLPDIGAMTKDLPTEAQLNQLLLIFNSIQARSGSGKDKKVEISGTKKRDLAGQRQQEPVAAEMLCMTTFWLTATACDMLSQYASSSASSILINAAQAGSHMRLANFFVEYLGETYIVRNKIDPNNHDCLQEYAMLLLTEGHIHHGNLVHCLTSPLVDVKSSREVIINGVHQLCVWSQSELWVSQFYASIKPFDGSTDREDRIKEAMVVLNDAQRTEPIDVAISILEGELHAIQQAKDEIQKLLATSNPEEILLSLTQLFQYEKAKVYSNFAKMVLLQQELMKLGELPQVSQEQARLDSKEPAVYGC